MTEVLRWKGKMDGQPAQGEVEAGAISGTFSVVSMVEALVAAGSPIGFGPWTFTANLTDARAARATIRAVLDGGVAEFKGMEVPPDGPVLSRPLEM